ncbi:MAG: beta-aspartyl-peptidase [Methylocystaceae bacterium]|nr:beta-aspartyl-peptidase [Methylocystaceae bacterium]
MFILIKNSTVYTPFSLGVVDVFIANGKIAQIGKDLDPKGIEPLSVIDAKGKILVPGFVDGHVHLIGGGGEGGFTTRTPEVILSDLIKAGVTTVVGLMGTDSSTRHIETLLAKTYALRMEGISAYMFTGAYAYPSPTLTNSIKNDITFLDPVIGLKTAIADHRAPHVSLQELKRITMEARIGGMQSAKVGRVVVHLGGGEDGFPFLEEIIKTSEIPRTQFIPTHVNRKQFMMDQAYEWMIAGGYIDLTAGINPDLGAKGGIKVSKAIAHCIQQSLPLERFSVSSDGNGSSPRFSDNGELIGLTVSGFKCLLNELKDTHLTEKIPLDKALIPFTTAPAKMLGLDKSKGEIAVGKDADCLLLNQDLNITDVLAQGEIMMQAGTVQKYGTFER